ncbi:MAG: glutamate dehydrogenase [Bacteroidetes bacterium 4572_77]|nr:MAG: glutamate dehydrogenase [Bacteroidetes bacterium 4572_77]
MEQKVQDFMAKVIAKNPAEGEFHQAVQEVVESLIPFVEENPQYKEAKILERMVEPERVIMFRVPWIDDKGEVQINKGFRIEMNSAIGPYKGGLRFHPTVNLGVLSQSFMSELFRHIGPNTDILAGDIGVGGREIGFLFGQYKRLRNEFTGVLTGKGLEWGGSLIRPEATGYGTVYFAKEMLSTRKETFEGKVVAISGSGNVAQYAAEKVNDLGGKVVTLSDSSGYIYDDNGIDTEKLAFVMELKNVKRGRIKEYAEEYGCEFHEGQRPWGVKCDVALPCATQNEINEDDAKVLIANGCCCVSEGANMPSTIDAINVYLENKILYGPSKAANAGSVAVSGLEMSQNSQRLTWTREEVDTKLHTIMVEIHQDCVKWGTEGAFINYIKGANIAGFVKVADAMLAQGVV